ncbi:MAG: hypothetical protein IKZ62_07780 [Prevotella sp.]|nr:hypothetical protein [Prevotella sp.]
MKKVLEIGYATIFVIFIFSGIVFIIVAFAKSRNESESFEYLISGASCIIFSFLIMGFSYIVKASCKYLERCETEDNNIDE